MWIYFTLDDFFIFTNKPESENIVKRTLMEAFQGFEPTCCSTMVLIIGIIEWGFIHSQDAIYNETFQLESINLQKNQKKWDKQNRV